MMVECRILCMDIDFDGQRYYKCVFDLPDDAIALDINDKVMYALDINDRDRRP